MSGSVALMFMEYMAVPLFGENFEPWVVMILPPGGFFVLGAWLMLFAFMKKRKEKKHRLLEAEAQHAG